MQLFCSRRRDVFPVCVCTGDTTLSMERWMFEQQALQEYILLCCQNPAGGLLDKPGKSVPHTHTHTPRYRVIAWNSLLPMDITCIQSAGSKYRK